VVIRMSPKSVMHLAEMLKSFVATSYGNCAPTARRTAKAGLIEQDLRLN